MLHTKHFFFSIPALRSHEADSDKPFQDFLNEIGKEKIVQIVCGVSSHGPVLYTVIYED